MTRHRLHRRQPRIARLVAALLLLAVAVSAIAAPASAETGEGNSERILRVEADGAVTTTMTAHLADAVAHAEDGGYHALLVVLDTPGGLSEAMGDIVQSFLGADVPVIVYVAPSSAKAASAGALIAFSAHVAAMAPGTNIGAATPVALGDGELDEPVADKVVNDAAAYAEAIAQARGRDVDFAVATVTEGCSAAAEDAARIGAVDLMSDSEAALLAALDGHTLTLEPLRADAPDAGTQVTLATADAAVDDYDLSPARRVLQALANPELALLFITLGTLGVLFELANPGSVIPGVLGAVLLILGFYGLAVLPTSLAGVLLLALALGLFVAELFAPGIGVSAALGAVALVAAGLLLFPAASGVTISLGLLIPLALALAAVALATARLATQGQRSSPYAGLGADLVGLHGEVRHTHGATDWVWVNGELWQARARDGELVRGQRVEVVALDGLEVVVAPLDDQHPSAVP